MNWAKIRSAVTSGKFCRSKFLRESSPIREATSEMHAALTIAERNGVSGNADLYQSRSVVTCARTNVWQSCILYLSSIVGPADLRVSNYHC